jgi:hypothetical protein
MSCPECRHADSPDYVCRCNDFHGTKCAHCKRDTTDETTWPSLDGGEICQECWEEECDKSWWEMVNAINGGIHE